MYYDRLKPSIYRRKNITIKENENWIKVNQKTFTLIFNWILNSFIEGIYSKIDFLGVLMRKFVYLFNVIFILLFVAIHIFLYSGVFVISSHLLIGVVLAFTINSKLLLSKKKILLYMLFVVVAFYILLPNYTMNESKTKVEEVNNISINTSKRYYYNTVPISVEFNIASLLQTRRFYYFVFYKNGEQKIVLVNPMTNELIIVNEEYWGTRDS